MSKAREERKDFWRMLIAQQQQSGVPNRAFCQQHGTSEHSFYQWRKRLAQQLALKFALVETCRSSAQSEPIEVMVASGERLRIPSGCDAATLRLVLSALGEAR